MRPASHRAQRGFPNPRRPSLNPLNCAASTRVPLCSTNDDPGCFTTCLHTECGDDVAVFYPAVPEESCGLGLGCLFDCTESDEPLAPCISTCYAQLTAEAQGQLVEFGPCIASPENLTFSECFDIGISCVGSSDEVTTFTCIDTRRAWKAPLVVSLHLLGVHWFFLSASQKQRKQQARLKICSWHDHDGERFLGWTRF